ncbi:uncharacterized protein LOC130714284 [Lotus japonicus]|uniref:Uncharacterized protein n=1 Tax=Lotus japonicus TaxID=34305 RepID=N0DKR4_LOTJA|nr:uncharacterized protein LOC130714284 [Lotus japonicus]BAN14783.1 hypothetical protein [Lotus japonicus]
MEEPSREEADTTTINNNTQMIPQVLQVLQALKQASHDIQHSSSSSSDDHSPAINALLQLHTTLSTDSPLSHHLHRLKTLLDSLHNAKGIRSFLTRPLSAHSISRVAASIEAELQAWIDRETTQTLSRSLTNNHDLLLLLPLLTQLIDRVNQGFDREFQNLVLTMKLFSSLESLLFDEKCQQPVREHAGMAIAALIRFNKDVFVGQVLMGPTVRALVSMASVDSLDVLCSLVKSIRSPFVDEIESNGEIPKIIALLGSDDLQLTVLAVEVVLEIGYFGRKEAIEAMMKEGVVEKLVELQRLEVEGGGGGMRHPFASCVAMFAVQLDVGEGLRQREKRALKPEILERVRKASLSDAESATIVAEVLWGSSP